MILNSTKVFGRQYRVSFENDIGARFSVGFSLEMALAGPSKVTIKFSRKNTQFFCYNSDGKTLTMAEMFTQPCPFIRFSQ